MPITEILEKNCKLYGSEVCLVEINPERQDTRRVTWKEYDLIEPTRAPYIAYFALKPGLGHTKTESPVLCL